MIDKALTEKRHELTCTNPQNKLSNRCIPTGNGKGLSLIVFMVYICFRNFY